MNKKLTNNFKGKAQASALQSFIKVMKQHNLYIPFTQEAISFVKKNERGGERDEDVPTLAELLSMNTVTDLLVKLQRYMIPIIEHNFLGMRREDTQYEYLIHCVNTYIQVIVEQGMCRREKMSRRNIPPFDALGRETFNYAAKLVFGEEFKEVRQDEVATPSSEEEKMLVNEWIRHAISQGLSIDTVIQLVSDRLKQLRLERERGNCDVVRDIEGGTMNRMGIPWEDIEGDDDEGWEDEIQDDDENFVGDVEYWDEDDDDGWD